jgi:hypothetical protein
VSKALAALLFFGAASCGAQVPVTDPTTTALPSGLLSGSTTSLAVTLTKTCGAPGEPQRARAKADPGASVFFISTYPNGPDELKPESKRVTADARGRASWEWLIPAKAKPGQAVLITQSRRGGKEARFVSPYQIAPGC